MIALLESSFEHGIGVNAIDLGDVRKDASLERLKDELLSVEDAKVGP